MGDFAAAKTYSDEALAMYDYLYDYTTISLINSSNPWKGINVTDFRDSYNQKNVIWNRYHRYDYQVNYHLYHPDLVALYDKDNDQRWKLFSHTADRFGKDYSPNYLYAKYRFTTQIGISVEMMILVNAEAKARTGDDTGAIAMLNTLLEKRLLNFTPLTTATVPDVLQRIKEERRKEFAGTAINFLDLKRYHAYGETIPTFTRTINGQTYTLEPGSSKYVCPISAKVLLFNPNL
jgi:hypothetical protein